jgi:CRP-like cAMP-binding protein
MTPREIFEAEQAKAAARPPAQSELLTAIRLQLNPAVRRKTLAAKRVVMRSAAGDRRLVLTQAQAAILTDFFSTPSTVPTALATLLGKSDSPPWTEYGCPPLGEFYELILQAHTAGVLVAEGATPARSLAFDWRMGVPVRLAWFLGMLAIPGGIVAVGLTPLVLPSGWGDFLAGWVLACALLSLGQTLAAGALIDAGCEARALRFRWRTLLPHFALDTDEALMGGRDCEFAVAALRATPIALGAGVLAWQQPGWLAPVLAGFFWVLAPWRGSAAWQALAAWRNSPRFTVHAGALFEPRRQDVWAQWRAWCADVRMGAELRLAGWLLLWAGLAGIVCAEWWPAAAARGLAWFGPSGRFHPTLQSGLVAVAAVVVLGLGALAWAKFRHWRLQRAAVRPLRGEATLRAKAALAGDVPEVLRQVPLLQGMPKLELLELARAMQTVEFKPGEIVFWEDAPGDTFNVVLAGEFEVIKNRAAPARGTDVIGRLGPGDSFGEIALLDGTARTATVRAVQPGKLLQLAKWDFMKLVAAQVGTARVHDLLQHAVFLGRLVFMAGWPFEDLLRFAQACTTHRYPAGAKVLEKGETNAWFFLIFDGAFEARDNRQVLRRMQPGDYFGEISLLDSGRATADVFALEESRCLLMHRNDFLAFFAHDYRIGLRMEAIAIERRGTRLFVSR